MARLPYITLADLRGGINDSDSPVALPDTQVVGALNVDYRAGLLGQKRGGLTALALTNSVFERAVPRLGTQTTGGGTAGAVFASSFPAIADADGTGAANHLLIVRVTTKVATNVTLVDLGGVALTSLGEVTNGNAGRLEVWYLKSPALAGGTITVTIAANADCSYIAERWIDVDNTINPGNFASTTPTSATNQPTIAATNATFMAQYALAWSSTTTSDAIGVGQVGEVQRSDGTARVLGVSVLGMKPTTQFNVTLGGAVDLVVFVWTIKGRVDILGNANHVLALMRHTPTNDLSGDELWAQDSFGRLDRRVGGVWQTGVPVVNYGVGSLLTGGYGTNGASAHGKLFLALEGGSVVWTRGHVWDGTVLRFVGFATPAVLTAANTAGAGTYAGDRYFRFRYVEKVAGVIVRRSEPCASVKFTPSGVKDGTLLTKPAAGGYLSGDGETDWEIEASLDGVLFYRIATQVVGTTTYTDTVAFATGYSTNPLSENLGEYTPLPPTRHVSVDDDRVVGLGSFFTPALDSRVVWTALTADDGVGNDERVPIAQRHFIDLDALTGGRITATEPAMMGGMYVFKLQRIYKLVRSGNLTRAYDTITISRARGSLPLAVAQGVDENGVPCVYFVDPSVGACRFGVRGVEDLMQQRRVLAARINKASTVSARVVFYPKHWLVWVFVSLDAGATPTQVACFSVRTKGWTDYDGRMGTGVSVVLFPNAASELRPYIAAQNVGTSYLYEADNGVNDDGTRFRGYFTTRSFQPVTLHKKFSIIDAVVHGRAAAATIGLGIIRNFGVERKDVTASLAPDGAETYINEAIDNARMAECSQVQFELGDPASYSGSQLDQTWVLDQMIAEHSAEEDL